jgi:hypothetical protein
MMIKPIVNFACFVLLAQTAWTQRTIGLIEKVPAATSGGYTLFTPISSRNTFLIDSCGYLVKQWNSAYVPGQSACLLTDGSLLRTARLPGNFTGGGIGGRIEIIDWDGNVTWFVNLATEKYHQHHVAHPMPNGNILTVVWYKYSREEAIKKGFNPAKLTNQGIWSDRILEIKPLPDNQHEIVWEWDFWDHTIQDLDPVQEDFGDVAAHPELLDVNFFEDPGANPAEWLHVNALDYNEKLDQIIVSSKYHNEIYIIDHSTTTEEAKGHTGGRYGKGGDFLYRWGNPRSYRKGGTQEHWLFGQHDAQWIDEGLPGAGNILLFNNGSNRTGTLYSAVEEIKPPLQQDGKYGMESNGRFGPEKPFWSYTADPVTFLYSARVSGAQRLQNGHTLICEGNKGNFIEIDGDERVVWKYRNPVNNFGAATQGFVPQNNDVFNAVRYSASHPALAGRQLTGFNTLELNTQPFDCNFISSSENPGEETSIFLLHDSDGNVSIRGNSDICYMYKIFSINGVVLHQGSACQGEGISTAALISGMYFINLQNTQNASASVFKFVKI